MRMYINKWIFLSDSAKGENISNPKIVQKIQLIQYDFSNFGLKCFKVFKNSHKTCLIIFRI